MKKFITLLLIGSMLCTSFVACGNKEDTTPDTEQGTISGDILAEAIPPREKVDYTDGSVLVDHREYIGSLCKELPVELLSGAYYEEHYTITDYFSKYGANAYLRTTDGNRVNGNERQFIDLDKSKLCPDGVDTFYSTNGELGFILFNPTDTFLPMRECEVIGYFLIDQLANKYYAPGYFERESSGYMSSSYMSRNVNDKLVELYRFDQEWDYEIQQFDSIAEAYPTYQAELDGVYIVCRNITPIFYTVETLGAPVEVSILRRIDMTAIDNESSDWNTFYKLFGYDCEVAADSNKDDEVYVKLRLKERYNAEAERGYDITSEIVELAVHHSTYGELTLTNSTFDSMDVNYTLTPEDWEVLYQDDDLLIYWNGYGFSNVWIWDTKNFRHYKFEEDEKIGTSKELVDLVKTLIQYAEEHVSLKIK